MLFIKCAPSDYQVYTKGIQGTAKRAPIPEKTLVDYFPKTENSEFNYNIRFLIYLSILLSLDDMYT